MEETVDQVRVSTPEEIAATITEALDPIVDQILEMMMNEDPDFTDEDMTEGVQTVLDSMAGRGQFTVDGKPLSVKATVTSVYDDSDESRTFEKDFQIKFKMRVPKEK